MTTQIIMPRYDWAQTEGTIVTWVKKDKEPVEKGEIIAEVESMKTIFEVEAPDSGILHIVEQERTTVPIGNIIALIAQPGEELPSLETAAPVIVEQEPSRVKEPVAQHSIPRDVRISPLARKIAMEHTVDVTKIKGTGPEGRITKEDVLSVVEEAKAAVTEISAPSIVETAKVAKELHLTGMRRMIGERLSKSYREAVHVSITMDVDMSEVIVLRGELLAKIKESRGVSLTYTDVIVKAVAMAIKDHRMVNSILDGDNIKIFENINIGVAVALEEGLIAPVIRDADKKSLVEISQELGGLTEKTKQRTLSPHEYTGGTFTVTNLGMFGVHTFEPIINPPESAILGVGAIEERAVVNNGQVVARSMMTLSLIFDHRILDGAQAAKFLRTLKGILEDFIDSFIFEGQNETI